MNAIHPGFIISVNDGQKHYIGYEQLMHLHELNPKDCIRWEEPETYLGRNWGDYKHIFATSLLVKK